MPDSDLKARHRAMWASGDYPSMVETFLLPLGPQLVAACGIGPGMTVLDEGRGRAEAAGLTLDWTEADAEQLPFGEASFAVVMFSIGAMFAPQPQHGPTLVARANAAKDGRKGELDAALDAFCNEQDLGSAGDARFELEYLLAVGTRA
jgi:hypothetical protein